MALQGIGWETWEKVEKSERGEEEQGAGQATADHPSWGWWPTLLTGIPGLELAQDWYRRRLNGSLGRLCPRSFLQFAPGV